MIKANAAFDFTAQALAYSEPAAVAAGETPRTTARKLFVPDRKNSRAWPAASVPLVLDRVVLTEDTTWQGTVLVNGYVIVPPNVTLRLEAGVNVYFTGSGEYRDSARLVVQGRIQALGTAENPILLTSDRTAPLDGDWGGILLVSSEKRNILEQCRIEYAVTSIEAVFSTLSLKSVAIANTGTGLSLRDSFVQFSAGSISGAETAIRSNDSELEMQDVAVVASKNGLAANNSALALTAVEIRENEISGIVAEDCRIKISAARISGNGDGAILKGGEGQIVATGFSGNRKTALHLSGSRIRLQRSHFINNGQDALRVEDGRSLVWGNSFSGNGGYNLYNSGRENVIALQNWWDSVERSKIMQKIYDSERNSRSGSVRIFPWLEEKPRQGY